MLSELLSAPEATFNPGEYGWHKDGRLTGVIPHLIKRSSDDALCGLRGLPLSIKNSSRYCCVICQGLAKAVGHEHWYLMDEEGL